MLEAFPARLTKVRQLDAFQCASAAHCHDYPFLRAPAHRRDKQPSQITQGLKTTGKTATEGAQLIASTCWPWWPLNLSNGSHVCTCYLYLQLSNYRSAHLLKIFLMI